MVYEHFGFAYAPMVATFLWSIGIGLFGYLVVFRLPLFDMLLKEPLAGPIMGLPSVMFAFLMVFMASAAWQNISLARTSLVNEHAALARMVAVPIEPAASKQQLQAGMRAYLTAVLEDEWGTHHNQERSAAADTALAALEADMWKIESQCHASERPEGGCTSGLAISTYLKALDDLRLAREQRLSLGFQGAMGLKWALAISLAMITSLAIAAAHRTSPRTAIIGLVIFCSSIWMSFSVVTLNIQPYRGPDALSPAVLQAMRARL